MTHSAIERAEAAMDLEEKVYECIRQLAKEDSIYSHHGGVHARGASETGRRLIELLKDAGYDIRPKREDGCTCHQIMADESHRHFNGCPKRAPSHLVVGRDVEDLIDERAARASLFAHVVPLQEELRHVYRRENAWRSIRDAEWQEQQLSHMTEHKEVEFANGWPKVLRYSSILARVRAEEKAAESDLVDPIAYARARAAKLLCETLEDLYRTSGNTCSEHGHLEDPILFTVDYDGGSKVAFACPQCSDDRLRVQWENEPPGWLG